MPSAQHSAKQAWRGQIGGDSLRIDGKVCFLVYFYYYCKYDLDNEIMKRIDLEDEIRDIILASVDVEGLTAEDLPAQSPLFGEGVGLDSIDALEIGAALRKKYQVKFKTNADENRAHFHSIATLATFIAENLAISLED